MSITLFFPGHHHVYSHFDIILATEGFAQCIKWVDIGKWTYSGHMPVCIKWVAFEGESAERLWRLGNLLLEADGISSVIEAEI